MMPQAMLHPSADQHGANVLVPGLGDAQRSGEGEHHDQPEEHFRDALGGIEHAPVDRPVTRCGAWAGGHGNHHCTVGGKR